jgi:hypothetical protein
MRTVWVFNGEFSNLPAGVFSTKSSAEDWIRQHSLSGTLSEFPLDRGAYDHAVDEGLFKPKKAHETEPQFIETFSPRLYHDHWWEGKPDSGERCHNSPQD